MNLEGDKWYTITLHVPMTTTNYGIVTGIYTTQTGASANTPITTRTYTKTNFIWGFNGANALWGGSWYVYGY